MRTEHTPSCLPLNIWMNEKTSLKYFESQGATAYLDIAKSWVEQDDQQTAQGPGTDWPHPAQKGSEVIREMSYGFGCQSKCRWFFKQSKDDTDIT